MKRFVHEKSTVDMLHEFEGKLREAKAIESSQWIDDETGWELIAKKPVYDFDGYLTEYTLWHHIHTDEWVTVFGDSDLYDPTNTVPDMEFENNEQEARDWFDGYGEDDEADEYAGYEIM